MALDFDANRHAETSRKSFSQTQFSDRLLPSDGDWGSRAQSISCRWAGRHAVGDWLIAADLRDGAAFRIVPLSAKVQIDSVAKDPQTDPVMVHVVGVPFKSHRIHGALSVSQAFTPITTMTAGGDGTFTFDATSLGKKFYHVSYP